MLLTLGRVSGVHSPCIDHDVNKLETLKATSEEIYVIILGMRIQKLAQLKRKHRVGARSVIESQGLVKQALKDLDGGMIHLLPWLQHPEDSDAGILQLNNYVGAKIADVEAVLERGSEGDQRRMLADIPSLKFGRQPKGWAFSSL